VSARMLTRSSLCVFVALAIPFATGCGLLRGFRPDPGVPLFSSGDQPNHPPNQNPTGSAPDTIPGGTVIAAGGPGGHQAAPQGQPNPQLPLPAPRPFPGAPGWATEGQPPLMMPPAAPPGFGGPSQFADPHLRLNPTVTGGRGQLAPWETPADRMVELSKQLEALLAQNRDLHARLKELETRGLGREQALLEAMREIDAITAAGIKQRAALQAQIDALQGKIKQMEEEDIVILKLMIDALKKLLPKENP
jgi:hypothetical protein